MLAEQTIARSVDGCESIEDGGSRHLAPSVGQQTRRAGDASTATRPASVLLACLLTLRSPALASFAVQNKTELSIHQATCLLLRASYSSPLPPTPIPLTRCPRAAPAAHAQNGWPIDRRGPGLWSCAIGGTVEDALFGRGAEVLWPKTWSLTPVRCAHQPSDEAPVPVNSAVMLLSSLAVTRHLVLLACGSEVNAKGRAGSVPGPLDCPSPLSLVRQAGTRLQTRSAAHVSTASRRFRKPWTSSLPNSTGLVTPPHRENTSGSRDRSSLTS